jgi:molybdate transport repressor ModE-like protein
MSVGGKDGGGAQLTKFGTQLISTYRAFESAVDVLAVKNFANMSPARGRSAEAPRSLSRTLQRAAKKQKK